MIYSIHLFRKDNAPDKDRIFRFRRLCWFVRKKRSINSNNIVIDRSIDKDSELHPLVRCRRRYATAKRATGLYLENGKMSLAQQRNDVAAQSKLLPS